MARTLNYFAYGSNMLLARLRERTPSCRFATAAVLPQHRLAFHKRGADRSGKCDAFFTGQQEDRVHGVVYRIDAAEKAALDRAEGEGYRARELTLIGADGEPLQAFAYIACSTHIEPSLRPYSWYRALVLHGARVHGFPAEYTAAVEAVTTQLDADLRRARRLFRLLEAEPGIEPRLPPEETFWRHKSLEQMSAAEWESLCDGCGRCCVHTFEDEEEGRILRTDVACRLLDAHSCRCADYPARTQKIADCMVLKPQRTDLLARLPASCGYRRVSEGRDLAGWHPLVTRDPNSVHEAGISVRGRVFSEEYIHPREIPLRVVHWAEDDDPL